MRKQVFDQLEKLRNDAYLKVLAFGQSTKGVQLRQVRANIFLPDTEPATTEGTCTLAILNELHVGMKPADGARREEADRATQEIQLRFKPNQGATGVVFAESRYDVAQVVKEGGEDGAQKYVWPDKYSLTDAQKRAIDPDLKWVISLPLNYPNGGALQAMGVLNVDGSFALEKEHLEALLGVLAASALPIAASLAGGEKRRVSLLIEDVK